MSRVILKMNDIHKKFPGVYALKNAQLDLEYGEVHALLGENGAGKSTLIKVLGGIYKPDQGEIYFKDEKIDINSVHDAQARGISIIHQEICLVPYMTVAENFFLGREADKSKSLFGSVDDNRMNLEAQEILDQLDLDISATQKVDSLSIAKQQMVEIAKALLKESSIIVMDEPTASLSGKEVDKLFDTIKKLKKKDIAIIYISHRMEELFKICDKVTVMRDGEYIGTRETTKTTMDELIMMMVGRELKDLYVKGEHQIGEPILEVRHLSNDKLKNINFKLHKGELLGISGLVGAGRSELAKALFGIDKISEGQVILEGKEISIASPLQAMKNGIALVPESRKEEGLVLIGQVGFNITLPVIEQFDKGYALDNEHEDCLINQYIKSLNIKTPSASQIVGNLSGGNQQKIVIAKWLASNPKVLILDEPTRGVDVGAKGEIYGIMTELVKSGVSIIMISSELPEVINMSDRVLVMHGGQITGELQKEELEQEKIMKLATGGI
ncbi:MAG: ABC-type sugar transport system, ATPase component [Clostridia bacterium]|jgi:ribose transport system ATP-binding protein/inositol transport system ATP-binding protein|nr:ABC-type sugar transport system, ATPase component [Clostridia bacterium]